MENHYYKILEKVMDNRNKERQNKPNENTGNNVEAEDQEISVDKLNQLMKEVNEEVSELQLKASKSSVYKFVSPPSTQKDYLKTLSEVDSRYELSKHFLDGHKSKNYDKNNIEKKITEKDLLRKTPQNFLISNLVFPKTNTDIILCGVERRSYIHASMLSDLMIKYNPGLIYVQISPDEPLFIRKPRDYDEKLKEK